MGENALLNQLSSKISQAMKDRDSLRLSVLRMLKTALMNEKISFKHDLSDAEEITVVSRLAKQRKEAAFEYHKGNRAELAEKEEREFEILKEFLPDQLSESKIDELILEAIKESQAGTLKDMGKVMKIVAPQIKGRADGKLVSQMVQKRLSVS